MTQLGLNLPGQGVNLRNPIHLVPKKLHPVGVPAGIGGINLQHVSPDAEASALKIHIISRILNVNQLMDHLVPVLDHAGPERNHHLLIVNGASQSINAGYRSHDNHIAAL